MIILSGYEKVKMAGIFGKDIDDKTYYEVYEEEDDFIGGKIRIIRKTKAITKSPSKTKPKTNRSLRRLIIKNIKAPRITSISAKKGIDSLTLNFKYRKAFLIFYITNYIRHSNL